jgi:hypothetical protein
MAANAAYGYTPDYTQWATWEPMLMPSGVTYYKVPNSNYLYDPFASGQRGRPTLYVNNKADYDAKQNAIKAQEKAQRDANDPLRQLLPLAGTLGGAYLANNVIGNGTAEVGTEIGKQIIQQQAAETGTSAAGQAAMNSAFATPQSAGMAGDFSSLGSTATSSAAESAAPGMFSGFGSLGIGPQAGIVAGTALTAKGLYDLAKGKKGDPLSRGVTAMSTFGFSELGRALGLAKPSTRDIAKKNTKDLLSKNKEDAVYQAYVRGMREQSNSAPPDPSKPFAGKYSNFNEYKQAGLEANDLTGVLGNLKTFGKDWTSTTQDNRVKATQALIDNNLYDSKKGEVIITDEKKAKEIVDGLGLFGMPNNPVTTKAVTKPAKEKKENPAYQWILRNGKPFKKML